MSSNGIPLQTVFNSLGMTPHQAALMNQELDDWHANPLPPEDECFIGTQEYAEPATEPGFVDHVHPYGNAYGFPSAKRELSEPMHHPPKRLHIAGTSEHVVSRLPVTPLINVGSSIPISRLPGTPSGGNRPLTQMEIMANHDCMPPPAVAYRAPSNVRPVNANNISAPAAMNHMHSHADQCQPSVVQSSRLPETPVLNRHIPGTPTTLPATPVDQRLPLTPMNSNMPPNMWHVEPAPLMPVGVSEHDANSMHLRGNCTTSKNHPKQH